MKFNDKLPEYLAALRHLTSDRTPEWGTMSAQHMVEHLITTVKLSNDKLHIPFAYREEKIPAIKRVLASDKPLPKNFTNPAVGPELKPLLFDSIEKALEILSEELSDFHRYFQQNPNATLVNPTFGPLNYNEWIRFHNKHFHHHLAQFGLI